MTSDTRIRVAVSQDAAELAALAAITFPLACPSHTTDAAKADFIAGHLTQSHFDGYLADPSRDVLVARRDGDSTGALVGYTMLVAGEPSNQDAAAAVSLRPTVEVSKFYVVPGEHGTGLSAALMDAAVEVARSRGAASVWLGVNEENARANAFYEKSGFVRVGTKRFLVGGVLEDDYVRERPLES